MAIDYKDIGQRIKQKRIEKGISQEKLSELIGIGPSHMSHIEGGTTYPSFEVFVSLLNALECSADEILCREIVAAKSICINWISEVVDDCSIEETKILSDTLIALKKSLRENKTT